MGKITDNLLIRQAAFNEAGKMVDPLVEKHGLTPYRAPGVAFTTPSTISNVEQHLDAIIRVADWLMEE